MYVCIPASIWVPRCLHRPFLAKQRAQKKQHNTHCTAQIEDRRADQNTRMLRRAWLFNRIPFDARPVQSLNVKHTSIKIKTPFQVGRCFTRTNILLYAHCCCGRRPTAADVGYEPANKRSNSRRGFDLKPAGTNTLYHRCTLVGKSTGQYFFFSTRRQSQKISMFFFKKLRGASPMSRPDCSLGPTIGENQDLVGPELTIVACFGHSRAMA